MDHPALVKAADWLESVQQAGGGWGETCRSYDDPSLEGDRASRPPRRPPGPSLGLIAAGRADERRRPPRHRLPAPRPSRADGTWDEAQFTGTGFPRVFYLKYHLYRVYFPLMALARYQAAIGSAGSANRAAALACRIPAQPLPLDYLSRRSRRDPASRPVIDPIKDRSGQNPTRDTSCQGGRSPMRFPLPMTTPDRRLRRCKKKLDADQEVPDGPDARAAARLQPDLHRLRPDPRIRVDDQAEALDRGVPGRRRRVRRPGRLDLRRRADDLPGHRRAGRQDPGAEEGRLSSAPTACSSARSSTSSSRPTRFFFNVHLDGMRKNARHRRRARGRLRRGDRRHQGRQGGRFPRLHQHHGLQGNRHGRARRAVRLPDRRSASTAS